MSPVPMKKKKKIIDPFTVRKTRYETVIKSVWIDVPEEYTLFGVKCVAACGGEDGLFELGLVVDLIRKEEK